MQTPDVSQLAQEKLPTGKFPADSRASFRVHFAPDVHDAILKHASEDTEVEICGILVGNWGADQDGPFASVTHYIRCDSAAKKYAEVTFTHESWDHINREMDTKYSDRKIVGWYHSHPDFGIFLSDRDQFIQQHFFSGPGQVAFVVDPVRQLEGAFVWKSGATQLIDHYWVGSQIKSLEASRRPDAPRLHPADMLAPAVNTPQPPPAESVWSIVTRLLGWMALFLMGWLLAGLKTSWERQMVLTGAIADFGALNVMRTGLEVHLEDLHKRLDAVADAVRTLSAPPPADETAEAAARRQKRWRDLEDDIAMLQRRVAEVNEIYTLSPEEQLILGQLLALRVAEQGAGLRAGTKPLESAPAGAPAGGASTGEDGDSGAPSSPGNTTKPQDPKASQNNSSETGGGD